MRNTYYAVIYWNEYKTDYQTITNGETPALAVLNAARELHNYIENSNEITQSDRYEVVQITKSAYDKITETGYQLSDDDII